MDQYDKFGDPPVTLRDGQWVLGPRN